MKPLPTLSTILCVFLCAFVQPVFALSASYTKLFQSLEPLSAPNISDDGKQLIFTGGYQEDQKAIYLAKAPNWNVVKPVIITGVNLPGENIRLIQFFQSQTKKSSVTFNEPVVSGNFIAFGAVTAQKKSGVFYADLKNGHWRAHSIAFDGDYIEKHVKIIHLDSPFIVKNNNILFLATLSDHRKAVFLYDIHKKHLYEVVTTATNTPKLTHYWDLSVNKNNFALRAYQGHYMAIYAYNGAHHFIPLSPRYDQKLPPSNEVDTGGPSYYQLGDKSYAVFHVATDRVQGVYKRYSLVGNIKKYSYNLPLVSTGEPAPYTLDPFYILTNPTLMSEQGRFFIAFEGSTNKLPRVLGVYAMVLTKATSPNIIKLVQPGLKFDKQAVVSASIGAVSIRALKVPVRVRFASGKYGIYLFTLKK